MKRKITVILAAGVDRYKEQIARDEDGTVRSLASCRAILEEHVRRHDGRVFNAAGDAILAEFASAVEAVRCAVAVQRGLREAAANRPSGATAPCLSYRIGVNLGDVVQQESGDLLGDGVNVAARLQGIAGPGGIAISRSVVEHAAARLPLAYVDRGFHALKNIPDPVHAYVIDLDGKPSLRAPGLARGSRHGWIGPAAVVGGLAAAALAFALLPRESGKSSAESPRPAGSATAANATPMPTLAVSQRQRCTEILERAQLGRLTSEDRVTLQQDCH